MIEVRALDGTEELGAALAPIWHYFGRRPDPAEVDQLGTILPAERVLAAVEDGRIVGGAGAYRFDTTVPGGAQVPTAGVMAVGVLPTHRRRGALTALMRRQLADAHQRGEPLGTLFAAEGAIYPRFGYGLASLAGEAELPKGDARLWQEEPLGRARLLDSEQEMLDVLPAIFDRIQPATPGMWTRSREWWKVRRLPDRPGRGALAAVVIELDGRPEAYALYRLDFGVRHLVTETRLDVLEALAVSPRGLDAIWRFLLAIDWVARIDAHWLPLDHPLFLWLREARRLRCSVVDALWVRLVDVGAALAARSLREGEVVLDVRDEFCPWNHGRWRVADGRAEKTTAPAELAVDAAALASVYLGGFTFEQLRWAGRVEELKPGAVERAAELFRTARQPWPPELF
ncbi:MAG TPA: GNAT family N-acetyltransferase [Gaiellaceae bacterium]|nr:GNAT family N-acetyltransferase [Gaiellaceae bacterium]